MSNDLHGPIKQGLGIGHLMSKSKVHDDCDRHNVDGMRGEMPREKGREIAGR